MGFATPNLAGLNFFRLDLLGDMYGHEHESDQQEAGYLPLR